MGKGRQDSNYFKKLLWRSSWSVGNYALILKYSTGSHNDWHKDPVSGGDHYRLNVVLNWWFDGGKIESKDGVLFSMGPLTFFRSDKNENRVTEVEDGTRYVFSFGFVNK